MHVYEMYPDRAVLNILLIPEEEFVGVLTAAFSCPSAKMEEMLRAAGYCVLPWSMCVKVLFKINDYILMYDVVQSTTDGVFEPCHTVLWMVNCCNVLMVTISAAKTDSPCLIHVKMLIIPMVV